MSLLILLNKPKLLKQTIEKKHPVILHGGGVFFLVLLVLFLYSCGLPTYSYLYPPELAYNRNDPENIPDKDLMFWNAYNNNSSIFSGYEIYYKIYDPLDSSATGSSTLYLNDKAVIDTATTAYTTVLENNGFTRLYVADSAAVNAYTHSETKPAFPIEALLIEEQFRIRLKFLQEQNAGTSFLAETFESELSFTDTPYLYRHVTNSSSTLTMNKAFDVTDFSIYDSDMPSSVDIDSYNSTTNSSGDYYIYITFYIMSYGRDIDDITKSVYSEPLYLGTLKFDCSLQSD